MNYNETDLKVSLKRSLKNAKEDANNTVSRGIDALVLMKRRLISQRNWRTLDVSANIVTAWISKARKFLKARPTLGNYMGMFTLSISFSYSFLF